MHIISEAIYLIALAIWLGSLVAISFIVAPAIFKYANSYKEAGSLVGRILQRFRYLEISCAAILTILTLVNLNASQLYLFRFGLVCLMLFLLCIYGFYINPILSKLRQEIADPDNTNPSKQLFNRLHKISVSLVLLNMLIGIILITLFLATYL